MPAEAVVKDRAYWVDFLLSGWALWMRESEAPEGLPREASGGLHGFTHQGDSEHAYAKLDAVLAEAVNAAIEGLPSPAEQCAIYRAYGVAAVYKMRDYASALAMAKLHVAESLERRGVWLGD